jgi:CRISPR-associated protein Csb1
VACDIHTNPKDLIMTLSLPAGPRLLVEASLRPVQGERFQPTGFPALGAATYQLHDGTRMLMVESAQSMANRLEASILEPGTVTPLPFLAGLPYVLVQRNGTPLTSSLIEAHRVNSPYILEGTDTRLRAALVEELGVQTEGAIDERGLARVLARYDVGSLIHGVFLAKKEIAGGRYRLRRALSAFIEARDVETVSSGGVKNDHVNPSGVTSAGFGNVPFSREEYTAAAITAYFNLDLAQLRAYRLPDPLTELLILVGIWKIRSLLDHGMRLRTACDLDTVEVRITRPEGYELPSAADMEERITALIPAAAQAGCFASPAVTVVEWTDGASAKQAKTKGRKGKVQEESSEEA